MKFRGRNAHPNRVEKPPSGNGATGQFPFNLVDGLIMSWFLRRNL